MTPRAIKKGHHHFHLIFRVVVIEGARGARNPVFLSADSFSSALLVVSSKGEGGREGELFDKFFVAFVFQLKPGILALNQVVCLEASTWTQN